MRLCVRVSRLLVCGGIFGALRQQRPTRTRPLFVSLAISSTRLRRAFAAGGSFACRETRGPAARPSAPGQKPDQSGGPLGGAIFWHPFSGDVNKYRYSDARCVVEECLVGLKETLLHQSSALQKRVRLRLHIEQTRDDFSDASATDVFAPSVLCFQVRVGLYKGVRAPKIWPNVAPKAVPFLGPAFGVH